MPYLRAIKEANTALDPAPSDILLLQRVKRSDREAFRLLFERYQPIVFRQVLFQTHDADLSHDIVQQTFVKIWENRTSLKPKLSFLAYCFRISGNLVRDTYRHRQVRERLVNTVPPPAQSEGDDPVEALTVAMLHEKINKVVNDYLPERCRAIFLLSRVEGKSNKEIAELLGLSVRTVEHQISHALKVLQQELKEYL